MPPIIRNRAHDDIDGIATAHARRRAIAVSTAVPLMSCAKIIA
ncbi:hypothetical protein [Dokdonella soli]